MTEILKPTRRGLLRGAAALGATGAIASPLVMREARAQAAFNWKRFSGQSIDVPAGVRFWLSGEPVEGTPARFAVTEDINAPRRLLRFIGLVVMAAYRQILRDDGQDAARTPSAQRIGT